MGRVVFRVAQGARAWRFVPLLCPVLFSAVSTRGSDWVWQHPLPCGETIRAAAAGEGVLVAVGDCGTIARLPMGSDRWEAVAIPAQQDLLSVAHVSGRDWVASGAEGTLLRSTDSGLHWKAVENAPTTNCIQGLCFGSAGSGLAVGEAGTILTTSDGGKSWAVSIPSVREDLRGVTFVGRSVALAVGESGTLLRSVDRGQQWTTVPLGVKEDLHGIAAQGQRVIAVGGRLGLFRNARVIVASTNAGETWSTELKASGPVLYGVSLGEELKAVACGESGILLGKHSTEGSWERMASPASHFLSSILHWRGSVLSLGTFGIAVTSTNSGKSWSADFSEKHKELNAISFWDPEHGIAVGEEGLILTTSDGGRRWSRVRTELQTSLYSVCTPGPNLAVALGQSGLVLRSTDAGKTWKAVSAGANIYPYRLDFIDEHLGVAAGYSTLLVTRDGGLNWQRRPIPAGVGDCLLQGIAWSNKSNVVCVGYSGIILGSSDGGQNWTRRESGTTRNLAGFAWSGPDQGTAVGDKGTILVTGDRGRTWRARPSGTEERLLAVAYADSRAGWAAGENGIVLFTSDGGETWSGVRAHTRNHLYAVCSRRVSGTYLAGWNASILHCPPPSATSP